MIEEEIVYKEGLSAKLGPKYKSAMIGLDKFESFQIELEG